MPVPLTLAAPAVAAGLAYLNAKGFVYEDARFFSITLKVKARAAYRQRVDRLNLFYLLEGRAQSSAYADKPLLVFEGATHTYAAVYDLVLRHASWLRDSLGVRPGDIVALDYQNCDTFVFLWFGLWAVGAKPAFINYNLTGNALAHCVRVATTRLCIVDPAVASNVTPAVREQLPDVNFAVFTPDLRSLAHSSSPLRPPNEDRSQPDATNMAMLIYTSGTTGLPKPAVVSWLKCLAGSTMGETLVGIKSSDTVYTAMPLYHSAASILSFLTVVHAGATQALGRKFSMRFFWDDVRATDATVIQYVGETLRYLLAAPARKDPSTGEDLDRKHRVRMAYGNGLRPDIWNRFKDRFNIPVVAELYAATEGTSGLVNRSANDFTTGAVGRSGWLTGHLIGLSVALVEVDWETEQPRRDPSTGLCSRVAPGEPGEMLFALPSDDPFSRFQGYYRNPAANSGKVLRDVFVKGDAWYRTGDVMRWDSEGRWYFNDRIGDTFRWKAENVSTAEVSQALGTHPSVHQANVYGVELPNHDGRAGCAAIHLDPSARGEEAELRSLAAHARSELPSYAVPLFLRVLTDAVGESQTTGTYKQQKSHFREAGVRPDPKTDAELGSLYWLVGDSYVPFKERDYRELEGGRVKL